MGKIKCIIKRPDEKYGHKTAISNTLENLQRTVGGHIQIVTVMNYRDQKIVCICDEEGKLKGYEKNFRLYDDIIVGTAIICAAEEDELTDLPFDLNAWKTVLDVLQTFKL